MYQEMTHDSSTSHNQEEQADPWQVYRELKEERNTSKSGNKASEIGLVNKNAHPIVDTCDRLTNENKILFKTSVQAKNINDGIPCDTSDLSENTSKLVNNDKARSNFPECFNVNNKYSKHKKKRHFQSPENFSQSEETDFDMQFTHPIEYQPSDNKTDFTFALVLKSDLIASLHEVDLEDRNGETATSGPHMNNTYGFTDDLNTNWTPTSERQIYHYHGYHSNNNQWYHGVSHQIPGAFVEDIGSCVDGNRCQAVDCHCRNTHWSPFLSPARAGNKERMNEFKVSAFDDHSSRRFVTSGRYRSPTSSESDPMSEEFELVQWDSNVESDFQDACSDMNRIECKTEAKDGKRESFNTDPNTPELDLSHLEGWHTAPNTPAQDAEGFYFVDCQTDPDATLPNHHQNEQNLDGAKNGIECRAVSSDTQLGHSPDSHQRNSKQSVSDCTLNTFTKDLLAALPRADADNNFSSNPTAEIKHKEKQEAGPTENVPIHKALSYFHEQPIVYSADAVEYLVDSETGEAKTCGKGSFGQVYNARFSDQSLYHIPIVVKEFDEEYTNKKDILQEAQKLMFLQDTGYVPICYGIVELSASDRKFYGIIQEFVGDGTTLEQMLWERVTMPVYSWLTIALQCCDGLARFHDKGILLNDIKSNNIIIIFYGNGYVCIKYIDFGLATDMRGRSYRNTKSLDEFIYLAPEVRLGHARTNVASDIFSLGYMLEQIHHFSNVKELKFVASLCMNDNPHGRIPVKAAVSVIEEQMEGLDFFNDTHSE